MVTRESTYVPEKSKTQEVTLITCTGARPEAFALLEKYVAGQTYKKPIQWIVVDDAVPETKCNMGQEYYRGPRPWTPEINTQRFNVELALSKARGDYILYAEDDDFIAPNYIETMLSLLKNVPAVGEGRTYYINLKIPGHKRWGNHSHSPLAATGFHKMYMPQMFKAVNSGDRYFDITFWKLLEDNNLPRLITNDVNLFVGIKGMPGRAGIGAGHKESRDYQFDPKFNMLKKLIGPTFAAVYENIYLSMKNGVPK